MLDLETGGTDPGSIVLSIGAVKFGGGEIHAEFYRRIDPRDAEKHGQRWHADTVLWWFSQSHEARAEICEGGSVHLAHALIDFANWIGLGNREIWGNGPTLDCGLLEAAYKMAGQVVPWTYRDERCYRTVKALSPVSAPPREGLHHHALEDARHQAKHLMQMINTL